MCKRHARVPENGGRVRNANLTATVTKLADD